MNMIITTFEHGELMSSRADGFFRYHDQERTEIIDGGSVDGPIGHFALLHVEQDVIAKYVSEHGDPWASMTKHIAPGYYVKVIGQDGTIWAFAYTEDGNGEYARMDINEAERVHAEWFADPNEQYSLSDCPWWDMLATRRPWWARKDCSGRMMESPSGVVCEEHFNAQPR